jgi:hypothetical protein
MAERKSNGSDGMFGFHSRRADGVRQQGKTLAHDTVHVGGRTVVDDRLVGPDYSNPPDGHQPRKKYAF